ncbi:MAG: hypothetical protein FJ390_00260 [Verrucomicrobia bacterium]|nr:hypothetical protein [Verrucomicrobiota bacterium]
MKKITKYSRIMTLLLLGVLSLASGFTADLGTDNNFEIGSDQAPVLAPVYCDFLNSKASSDSSWLESSYYDSSFMKTSHDLWASSDAAIFRSGWSNGYLVGSGYKYSVIPGHENDRIVAVATEDIQKEFVAWLKDQAPKGDDSTVNDTPATPPANTSTDTPVTPPSDTPVVAPTTPSDDTSVTQPVDSPVDTSTDGSAGVDPVSDSDNSSAPSTVSA